MNFPLKVGRALFGLSILIFKGHLGPVWNIGNIFEGGPGSVIWQ